MHRYLMICLCACIALPAMADSKHNNFNPMKAFSNMPMFDSSDRHDRRRHRPPPRSYAPGYAYPGAYGHAPGAAPYRAAPQWQANQQPPQGTAGYYQQPYGQRQPYAPAQPAQQPQPAAEPVAQAPASAPTPEPSPPPAAKPQRDEVMFNGKPVFFRPMHVEGGATE